MSRQRIPHLLKLMSSSELDTLCAEMLATAETLTGPACAAWMDAVTLINKHRIASFHRRSKQTPSARRKSLSDQPPQLLPEN